ncbi:hypothetical protein FRC02_004484 [Tulasnella sp. 418]|nr:hypothetical protein FRC02_004484 [Tulasnella sp. 418]
MGGRYRRLLDLRASITLLSIDILLVTLPLWLFEYVGGFIGLVTGLGILIIGCSIGVWWLLKRRDQNGGRPFPLLSQLKSKAFKRDGRSSSGGGAYGNVGNKPKRSAKSGWVRTPDERDDHSSDDEQGGVKLGTGSKIRSRSRSPNPEGVYLNDSNPFGNPSTPAFGGPYNDAFTTRPSTDSLDEAVMAGVHRGHRDSINSDPKSPISPTSFEGGTKFKEGF